MGVLALVGTVKGGFLVRSDDDRMAFTIDGPIFKGWKVTASARDPDGRWILGTASDVYGPALHVSDDLQTWRQIEHGPVWPAETDRKLNQIWTIVADSDRYLCGVDDAGLFESTDGGESWQPVEALNEHATREGWFPGAGGLCAHGILRDPNDPQRMWCSISSVGIFRTDDGGATWEPKNEGVPVVIEDETHADIGCCPHALVCDPDDGNLLWRRDHVGMFRSTDGGDSWERIEVGLPSWFGFPIVIDRRSRTLWAIPLESDEYRMPTDGKLTVYRSTDGGDSWRALTKGLPQSHAYMGVLRAAMDVDHRNPCGIYFGTTAGTLHASVDGGERWTQLPCHLPRILSVKVYDVAE